MSAYQSVLTVLGWSLLDSIWQMGALWIAYNMLTTGNTRISPAGKHNLVLLFVFIGIEWFVYTFILLLNEPTTLFLPGFISVSPSVNLWIPYLSSVYLVVLMVRLLQYAFQFQRRRKNKYDKSIPPDLQKFTDRYTKLLGIHRRVQVYLCGLAETAQTSGFFKPLILLPFSLITRLSPQQVEAILVHELYHIRRNDYLINICMSGFRGIFFFNPFAHLFYKALARERELACDDGVLDLGFAPDLYAEALFSLEKFRQPQLGFSLAADGNKPWLLMERIRRVLGKPPLQKGRINPLIYFSLLIAVSLLSLQPKPFVQNETVRVSSKPVEVIGVRYEFAREEKKGTKKEVTSKKTGLQKPVKIRCLRNDEASLEAEPLDESTPPDQAIWADNKVVRNFSNQPAADLSQDQVQELPGMPYVPSASLSYESPLVIIAADSARDTEIQSDIKQTVNLSNLKTIASLKELEIQIEINSQELNEILIKNQRLILPDQRDIQPLLKKMQRKIECKKKQIDQIRTRLQVSEVEIIHI
jgi:Zn-dependent protease with chaperone function